MTIGDDRDAPPGAPHETTAVLLTRIRTGDAVARDRLFARVLPVLHRWAHRRLPLKARAARDTDDLVQDTLLKAFRRLDTFQARGEGAFLAYLRQILLNTLRDDARRAAVRPWGDAIDERLPDPGPSVVERAIGAERLARFERALEALPEEQRQAVILRIEFGYSHQQIAEAMDKPSANAARMVVARALLQLARKLDEP